MRLRGFWVDGFGVLHDQKVEDVSSGLSVFFGENEAGKSTLLAFLRAMLFGFATGRSSKKDGFSRQNRYDPLRGGKYGGNLTLVTDDGQEFTVERRCPPKAGKLSIASSDGESFPENHIKTLLGFTTQDLFYNVFAFSLGELQRLSSLTSDEVSGAIYSAGAGMSTKPLPKVLQKLDKRMGELFKERGSTDRVHGILAELRRVGDRLSQLRHQTADYDDLKRRLIAVASQTGDLERSREELLIAHSRAETMLKAWEDWTALEVAKQTLAAIPEVSQFPKDGIPRFENAKKALNEAKQSLQAKTNRLDDIDRKRQALTTDEAIIEVSDKIERLERGRDKHDSAVSDLPAVRAEYEQVCKRFQQELADLGPDWDLGKLESFDTSVTAKDPIVALESSVDDARKEELLTRARLETARKALEGAESLLEGTAAELDRQAEPEFTDEAEIRSRLQAIRAARAPVREIARLRQDLRAKKAAIEDDKSRGQADPPWFLRSPGLGAALVSFVLVGVVLLVYHALGGPNTYVLVVAGLAFAASYPAVFRNLSAKKRAAELSREQAIRARQEAANEVRSIDTAIQDNVANIRKRLPFIDSIGELDDVALDDLFDTWREKMDAHREWSEAKRDHEEAERASKSARREFDHVKAEAEEAAKRVESGMKRWVEWLTAAGLRQDLTFKAALEFPTRVRHCRDLHSSVLNFTKRMHDMEAVVEGHSAEVREVARICGVTGLQETAPGVILDLLTARLDAAQGAGRKKEGLSQDIERLKAECEELDVRVNAGQSELAGLMSKAGAANEEEFRERADHYSERESLKTETAKRRAFLEGLVGPKDVDELVRALSESDKSELELEVDRTANELERTEEQLDQLRETKAKLAGELERLETAEETSSLLLEREELVAQLRDTTRRWSALAAAKRVLELAQEVYEKQRQPSVLRKASELFSKLTRGNYSRVVRSSEETSFDVRNDRGEVLTIGQLSRGTREQLLLAVRLGLVLDFAERQEKLPLIVDDVMANFDGQRTRAAADVFCEVAKTHQVLVFTCHQDTLETFMDAGEGTTRIYKLTDGKVF